MNMTKDDENWLAALSGERPADDTSTRQAAQIREFFLRQAKDEDQDLPELATQTRIMNALRAQGVFAVQGKSEPANSGLAALWAWLVPPGQGRGAGYAVAAGIAVAALALPLVLHSPAPDDASTVKGAPPVAGSSTPRPAPITSPGERVILSADPAADAREMVRELLAAGATVQAAAAGSDVLVTGSIPPAAAGRAATILGSYGLNPPADGALRLRFAKQ
jgi:hypothetical protein